MLGTCCWPVAMAENLVEALVVVVASRGLELFQDQGEEIQSLMDALSAVDAASFPDFRFTFVSDDEVDASAVDEFACGELSKFRELVTSLSEEFVPR